MAVYNRPSVYKKGLPWASGSASVGAKPVWGIALESLGIRKPARRIEQKIQAKPKAKPQGPSFLGISGSDWERKARTFGDKKMGYEYLPGTGMKMSKKIREGLMKELVGRLKAEAKKQGKTPYGINEPMLKAVLRRIENSSALGGSELYNLHRMNRIREEMGLKRKVQVWKKYGQKIIK